MYSKKSEKTVAENALKWWTWGINIDGCRVLFDKDSENFWREIRDYWDKAWWQWQQGKQERSIPPEQWRFPANFIHDWSDEVVGLFPDSKGFYRPNCKDKSYDGATFGGWEVSQQYNDSWSASRFFYCAKASKSERNKWCEGLEEKATASSEFRPNHTEKALKWEDGNPYGRWTPTTNNHPTVKPIKLMEYLVKLVSREWAIVLDPFSWSGSTLIACKKLDRQYIWCEMTPEYIEIANARLNSVEKENRLF